MALPHVPGAQAAIAFGVYGVATGLDGTIYATTLDALQVIAPDGTVTAVASWSCNFDDPSAHELAAAVALEGLGVHAPAG